MPTSGPARDAARRLVVERKLVRAAFEHLTADAFMAVPFEALGPAKAALKRFFSTGPWTEADDDALAAAIGTGSGVWRRPLDAELVLEYGWEDGRFSLGATSTARSTAETTAPADPLAASFDGPVVPEATPNPRTIRFRVENGHEGASHWYESAAAVAAGTDPAVARLFEFDEVANVLVGPDFVAVSLRRPADWERLLAPILDVVAEELGEDRDRPTPAASPHSATATVTTTRRHTRLDRAWQELAKLRPADPADLPALVEAATGDDHFRRQVAANLLGEAPAGEAAAAWARLITDPARSVRRATIDAMVGASRPELRPLLERALTDADAWVRWKALRGLVELDPAPSRDAIARLAHDRDFRVRLEVAAALRNSG